MKTRVLSVAAALAAFTFVSSAYSAQVGFLYNPDGTPIRRLVINQPVTTPSHRRSVTREISLAHSQQATASSSIAPGAIRR